MARFICSIDETSDENPRNAFYYGGFLASESDWHFFRLAWEERVLGKNPTLPYAHMTQLRSRAWREQNALSSWQADQRVDAAAEIIRSAGGLTPIAYRIPVLEYERLIKVESKNAKTLRDPSFLAYRYVVYTALGIVDYEFGQGHTVDFRVEENSAITKHIKQVHGGLPEVLPSVSPAMQRLGRLLGSFQVVPKSDLTVQAADVFLWHSRNFFNGTLDAVGSLAYFKMTTGDRGGSENRSGFSLDLTAEDNVLAKLSGRIRDRLVQASKSDS